MNFLISNAQWKKQDQPQEEVVLQTPSVKQAEEISKAIRGKTD